MSATSTDNGPSLERRQPPTHRSKWDINRGHDKNHASRKGSSGAAVLIERPLVARTSTSGGHVSRTWEIIGWDSGSLLGKKTKINV